MCARWRGSWVLRRVVQVQSRREWVRDRRGPGPATSTRERARRRATDAGGYRRSAARRRCSERRSRRETCICETPTRSAISDCVRSSPKRRNRISRSRCGRCLAAAKIVVWSSTSPSRWSSSPIASMPARVLLAGERRVERDRAVGLGHLEAVEHLLLAQSRGTARARRPRGGRPVRALIACWASLIRRARSWAPRSTWIAHPVSRKYRFSSPTIVGTANEVNAKPRSGSNRSTAFTSPRLAT